MLIINRQNNHYISVHGQLVVAVAQWRGGWPKIHSNHQMKSRIPFLPLGQSPPLLPQSITTNKPPLSGSIRSFHDH